MIVVGGYIAVEQVFCKLLEVKWPWLLGVNNWVVLMMLVRSSFNRQKKELMYRLN